MKEILYTFKEKLRNYESVYGLFMKTGDAAFVECAGYGGFDFVILDMEHGAVDFFKLQNLIRAAEAAGVLPIVRTYDTSEIAIAKVLDLGAKGVQIPQIQTAEEARRVVKATKFFPEGERGVCRFVRAANYSSTPREIYFKQANETLVILQVEGQKALKQLDDILEVKGVDILFIGPYDLSQSLGVPGQIMAPVVVNNIRKITKRARQVGVVIGIFCDTLEAVNLWRNEGIQYFSYSVDVGIFTEACASIVSQLKCC